MKLTSEQINFASTMTIKQYRTLRALGCFDWHMSASERMDPELYELVRMKLVRCYAGSSAGLYVWGATDAGRMIIKKIGLDPI